MSIPEDQWQGPETGVEKYRAFLLRCWKEADAGPATKPAWRFTLVQMGEGQTKRGFSSLEQLVAYLDEQLS